jgi:hypothetical protein
MMADNLGVVQKNGKFVVTKNGEPVLLPKSDGQSIITQFDNKEDANRYMEILSKLSKQKKYQKS